MKTFILVFLWIPIVMAFAAHGPGGSGPAMLSLLLIALMVEMVTECYHHHSTLSSISIVAGYGSELLNGNPNAERALLLFLDRR